MSAWSDAVAALSGLVGWWRLGETSGTAADNAEGNAAKDGTYTGTYTLNQGSLVSLVDADPSFSVAGAGYVTIADHSDFSLTTTSKLTIGFWHNPSAANNTVIIGKGTASNYEWAVYRSTSSYYALVWQSAGGTRATVNNAPTGPFPDGSRNFVVLTLDDTGSDAAQLYVNGLTGAAITGWTGSSTNGTSPVDIGRRPDNTAAHTGVVDEVFITNTAMTQAEVIALMRTAQPVVIPRGTGARNTGSESTYAITPATNFSGVSGAMAVLAVAYDNSGTNGADPYSSIADTDGNTWTPRIDGLNDPGAANAGVAGRIFTSAMNVAALTTAKTITVTFGSTTVARSYALWEVIPQTGYTIAYGTGAAETSATASPTITTGTIAAGDVVIGAIGREGNDSATADTDTSNGMWSGQQATGVGTTTSGNQVSSQYKVALASGTQTYNPTFGASRDNVEMWASIVQALANITVTPSTLALTLSTFAPTVTASDHKSVTPSTLALTLTAYAPTITASDHKTATPSTASLTLATFAPSVSTTAHQLVMPDTASLALATFAPTVTATAHRTVTPDVASLELTAYAPTVSATAHRVVTPDAVSITLSTFAPTVTAYQGVTVTPDPADMSLTSFAPTLVLSDHKTVTPATSSLSLSAFAPTVTASDHKSVTPTPASLALTAFAPNVVASDHRVVMPSSANLSLTTFAPSLDGSVVFDIAPATLTLSTFAPWVMLTNRPMPGVVSLSALSPASVSISGPAAASVTLSAPAAASVTLSDPAAATVSISDPDSGVVTI